MQDHAKNKITVIQAFSMQATNVNMPGSIHVGKPFKWEDAWLHVYLL